MEKRTNKMGIDNQKTSFEHQSLEVSMLDKDNFSDEELDSYLSKGEIKATDKVTIPPKFFSSVIVPLQPLETLVHLPAKQRARKPSISLPW